MRRYNGKVRFLENDINFTAGKIYEIKDGRIANDRGEKFPLYDEFWNFEQVKEYFAVNGQYDKQGILVEQYNPSTLKKVYISGPITGTDDYMERFAKAEYDLRRKGYEVINPAAVNQNLPASTTWEQYMEMSVCMLRMCNAIYMLKDWRKSAGAEIEHCEAKGKGYEIMEEIAERNEEI